MNTGSLTQLILNALYWVIESVALILNFDVDRKVGEGSEMIANHYEIDTLTLYPFVL